MKLITQQQQWRQDRMETFRLLDDNQNGKCFYCDQPFDDEFWPQLEHVVPKSLGGIDDVVNYVLSCQACNYIKGDDFYGTYDRDEVRHHVRAKIARRYSELCTLQSALPPNAQVAKVLQQGVPRKDVQEKLQNRLQKNLGDLIKLVNEQRKYLQELKQLTSAIEAYEKLKPR